MTFRQVLFYSFFIFLYCEAVDWSPKPLTSSFSQESLKLIKAPLKEKKFVIIVTAFNVKDWYKKNLISILAQKYSNYRVIYIDDCSTDGTSELVANFIKQNDIENKITLVLNKEWKSQIANHYKAAHMCEDDEIIVNLDCDDWFAHEYVLALLNAIYANQNIWLTCGSVEFFPSTHKRIQKYWTLDEIKKNQIREAHLLRNEYSINWWHPRTFYAWIFKQIKLEDLIYNNSFKTLNPSADSASMYPIVEITGTHAKFVKDILYIWNLKNSLSQWQVSGPKQMQVNKIIASWEKYKPLTSVTLSPFNKHKNSKADIIVFYKDDLINSRNQLKYIKKQLIGYRNIYMIYENQTVIDIKKQLNVEKLHENIELIDSKNKKLDEVLLNLLKKANNHILMINNNIVLSKKIFDLTKCIQNLEKTFAFAYYLNIQDSDLADFEELDNLGFWQINDSPNNLVSPYSLDQVLYRKSDLINILNKLKNINSLNAFLDKWQDLNIEKKNLAKKIGIFLLN